MNPAYLTRLETFTEKTLPNLDEVVLGALAYLAAATIPKFPEITAKRPLVVGSGNALVTGKNILAAHDAVFADEGTYMAALERVPQIDAVYLVSASGGKHAHMIAERLASLGKETFLLTSQIDAPAREFVQDDHVYVFPHIREPYTYNTSTYLGMLLSHGGESSQDILRFIEEQVVPVLPKDIGRYSNYLLLADPHFEEILPFFRTKFDELFGPLCSGRAFTMEEALHAKTVVESECEAIISFGQTQSRFGRASARITVPLPEGAGPAAVMAIGYYVIGRIQQGKHPYFKEHITAYTQKASEWFGHPLNPIVE